MSDKAGFSLVELMIIVAITAILASVAVPAYINYVNRTKQGEAIVALMTAKMDQEVFWADAYRYAATITCLQSFGNTCGANAYMHPDAAGYKIFIQSADSNNFTVMAEKKIYAYAGTDRITLSGTSQNPSVLNPEAIGYSLFKWLFD